MKNLDIRKIVNKYSRDEDYNLNGYLMHKNTKVAKVENTELTEVLNKDLLPIIMINENIGSFEA
ncbi:MAG: hypothetical protein ACRC68_11430 [Clostridium sp.]